MHSELATRHSPPATNPDEVLVRVQGVSKKFCRSLKRSLWYGLCDIAGELSPFGRRDIAEDRRLEMVDGAQSSISHIPYTPAASARDEDLREGEFYAVRDVSFELRRGECLGLIGHNGAGKTTLLKMLNGLIKPDRGRIEMNGRVGALIALGAGFNPILTGRENIYINGSVLGLSKKEIDGKIDEIIDFSEIGEFIDMPVQNYSSGMQVRLGFAVATAMNPDVLILDEVLAVGDAKFRNKCAQRIGSLMEKCAVIFVSHDAYSIRRICSEVLWMRSGYAVFKGDTETAMQLYNESVICTEELEPCQICGEYIRNVSLEAVACERIVSGCDTATDLAVNISFESSKNMGLGLCMANLVIPGEVVIGQSVLSEVVSPIHVGRNTWSFSLRDLHLARGVYSLVIGIFEEGGRKFALCLRHGTQFVVKGSPRFGPHYAPIAYKHN